MSKDRLEAFSDGVFSVVMTLLIFNIKVPTLPAPVTDAMLWQALANFIPFFVIFASTFAVLSTLWINHHYLFQSFARSVNRQLNLLNLLYLMFVAFVPFSATFIAVYPNHQPTALLYGVNLFVIALISALMTGYILGHPELYNDELSSRIVKQARFRTFINLSCYALGIAFTFIFAPLSVFFYVFPIIFNILPGTLTMVERLFGFRLT